MSTPPASRIRRARAATGLLFLTNGALLANLIPRYPEIKAALDMTDSLFGLSVAAFPLGAMIFGVFAAGLIRRFGSGVIATLMTITLAVCLAATAFMPEVFLFALALLLAGGADAIADVSQNAHGLQVQDAYGRSILNSFHALWSLGAVVGGFMAAGVLFIELDLHVHLVGSAVCFIVVALIAWTMTLPPACPEGSPETAPGADARRQDLKRIQWAVLRNPNTMLMVGALVLLAMAEAVVEDSGNSWSALYMSVHLGAPSAVAAFGFTALVAGQLIGRATADRFVDRFGQRRVIRTGGIIISVGMGLAIAWPTVPLTIAGFAAAGFGSSALIPAAYNAADDIPGLRPGVGLTVVSWFMRLGFLIAPPFVGALSDMLSLRWALLVVPLAGLVTIVLARVLPGRHTAIQQRL
ncbi:MFS transporter [Enteractinococcus helveticum]|uniref:Fucose permease n=1 Tax=Enteractinococcus helveticum TaxID=1837282 RepID=A0A1B7M2W1_9MICC|nr:MFS transporter [Enteractinococcus helveticum]OAV62933.1 fucose permease [Enteractinococcus helveticum]